MLQTWYLLHCYNSQLFLAFKLRDEEEARHPLEECICAIRSWMRKDHLKLNYANMKFLIIGYHTKLCHLSGNDGIKIGDSIIKASPSARNIGAIFGRSCTMKDHIHAMCRAYYCHIRNIDKVRSHLT